MPPMTSLQRAAVTLPLSVVLAGVLSAGAMAAAKRAAVFDFRLDDTSLQGSIQGKEPAEQQRLAALRTQLSDLLAKSGEYQPVDIGPVEQAAQKADLQSCGGCAEEYARKVGAQVAVIGWVQKVSNLILNINAQIVDVQTGQVLHAGSVDIRGNTDESWQRGLAYLAKNRLLEDGRPQ